MQTRLRGCQEHAQTHTRPLHAPCLTACAPSSDALHRHLHSARRAPTHPAQPPAFLVRHPAPLIARRSRSLCAPYSTARTPSSDAPHRCPHSARDPCMHPAPAPAFLVRHPAPPPTYRTHRLISSAVPPDRVMLFHSLSGLCPLCRRSPRKTSPHMRRV